MAYRPHTAPVQTDDRPYHIPGYKGYVPRMVNSFEKTYGNATRQVLTEQRDLNATRAVTRGAPQGSPPKERYFERGEPVLPRGTRDAKLEESASLEFNSRSAGHTQQQYLPNPDRIPGYTGYAPVRTRDLPLDEALESSSRDAKPTPIPGYTGFQPALRDTMLEKTYGTATRELKTGVSERQRMRETAQAQTSSVDELSFLPKPGRIPGYSGYVPESLQRFGGTYGNMTRSVFGSHQTEPFTKPVHAAPAYRLDRNPEETPRMMRSLPGYSGHIPAVKEQFGRTYGRMMAGMKTTHRAILNPTK